MTCSDGYKPSVPVRRFLEHRALLAYARTDQPSDFTLLKGDVQPAKRVALGPWYLVWENQRDATVRAEGDLDFRGTLGVDKEAPVGFREIRLSFDIDTDATEEQIASLIKLTERYCVIFQTLNKPPKLGLVVNRG